MTFMRYAPWVAALGSMIGVMTSPSVGARAEVQVVATMKPVHALVALVMGATGSPKLIVDGAVSPHTYALKPSDAKALGQSAVIFRMSERIEGFTIKLAKALPRTVEMVTLIETPGLALRPVRSNATFDAHDVGAATTHAHTKHDHDHDADTDGVDGHAWLDPDNATAMIDRIAAVLSAKDAANASTYAANATLAKADIATLKVEIAAMLQPVAGKPYILFHDATQYFETRFGLTAVGSISANPDIPPSGKRLASLRKKISTLGATCVFAEPNFEAKVVSSVTEGSAAKTGLIDPEGALLPAGPQHYAASMRALAAAHVSCLGR
jgi:zinc transport system substrate-binding protein